MLVYLNQLLERSALKWPDAPAVRFLEQSLSYRELDLLSGRLAAQLLAGGVRPGDRVGIYLHKSLECAVALYGILKSGGVYVPLDPAHRCGEWLGYWMIAQSAVWSRTTRNELRCNNW